MPRMNTCLVIPGVGASHGVRRETAGRIVKGRRERLSETVAEDPPVQIENCVQGAAPKTRFECIFFKVAAGDGGGDSRCKKLLRGCAGDSGYKTFLTLMRMGEDGYGKLLPKMVVGGTP